MNVLWIDDDASVLMPIQASMAKRGWNVTFASNAANGFKKFESGSYDLIIIDANLEVGESSGCGPALATIPEGSSWAGVHLAKALTKDEAALPRRAAATVLCSAYDESYVEMVTDRVLQGVPYVSKADAFVDPEAFLSRLAEIAGQEAQGDAANAGLTREHANVRSLQEVEEHLHDLRNGIAHTLPVLRQLGDRLKSLSKNPDTKLLEICTRFERASDDLLEALTDKPMANWDRWEEAEALRRRLAEELSGFAISKLSMIGDMIRRLSNKLAKLPKSPEYDTVVFWRREYELRTARAELDSTLTAIITALGYSLPGNQGGRECPFDTSEVLASLVRMEELNALRRGIEFHPKIEKGLILNHGSRSGYRRLMACLIDNAIKYSGKFWSGNTWISVSHSKKNEDYYETAIESWGSPLDVDERLKVLERGERGRQSNRVGTGLGLAIARQEVERFGGKISIASKDKGAKGKKNVQTTAVVTIPVKSTV